MDAYIKPPAHIPFWLKFGLDFAERKVGKELLAARILAWYPKAAIGAGVMEGLVAHAEGKVTSRALKLIRMQVSFTASCPFCIDMNSSEYTQERITDAEIEALQGVRTVDEVSTFTADERVMLRYARVLTATPVRLTEPLLAELLARFDEKEIVVIASTIAQVNFWTRFIQGVGVPPVGFSETCTVLNLKQYETLQRET